MDLIIRHANLPDGRRDIDIAIQGGRIMAVDHALPMQASEEIDAAGDLASPPFVDAHFHMDATLSYGQPRVNQSGTLLEGIALWGELKPLLTQEALVERAMQYCDWAVARGLLAMIDRDPSLAEPLVPGLPYLKAEAVYSARYEMARSVDDILARRTRARLLARGIAGHRLRRVLHRARQGQRELRASIPRRRRA